LKIFFGKEEKEAWRITIINVRSVEQVMLTTKNQKVVDVEALTLRKVDGLIQNLVGSGESEKKVQEFFPY